MRPGAVMVGLWVGWALSWVAAAAWSDRTDARPRPGAEVLYRIPLLAGAALMCVPSRHTEGALRLWHVGWSGAWACAAVIALGIAFAWWARVHLGRLWSGRITRKADHRVVDTGPYALVRHPIYTGLLVSLLATALAKGTIPGVAGFALSFLGLWLKARAEEGWLMQELPGDDYARYRLRVPMLVPSMRPGA